MLGYVIGRVLIALLFIPAYFRGEIYTSYELLQKRFGGAVRAVSAAIFLLYRTLGDGIRLHAAALVLAVAAGIAEWWCIVGLGVAMILYTEEGGVVATIWTDSIQMFVYLAGAIVCLVAVIHRLPEGGVGAAMAAASAAGKLALFDFSLDFRVPFTFWAGLVGGTFLTLATHGTDHYLVQRLLVARSQKDASAGLVLSGFLVMIQFALFLFLGTLLWAHYAGRPFARGDEVLPTFVSTELSGGWTGFILAAVVAAALSPSLNSMASTTVRDFYLPYFRQGRHRGPADARRPRVHRHLGDRADPGRDRGPEHGLGAAEAAGRPELRLRSDRGRVPSRRPHAPGHVNGDDDRDDGGAGHQPCRWNAGPVRLPHPGRSVDMERGGGSHRHVRGGNDPQLDSTAPDRAGPSVRSTCQRIKSGRHSHTAGWVFARPETPRNAPLLRSARLALRSARV